VRTDHGQVIEFSQEDRWSGSGLTFADLHELGNRLTAHVRLEEDELFPLIEATLETDALAALGDELERAERAGYADNWRRRGGPRMYRGEARRRRAE
jgi:hemerythrin-like domain-containing protein